MPQQHPQPGELYRHFKGNLYQVLTIAKDAGGLKDMVVYQGLYAPYDTYVRPLEEFVSGVDYEKYPEATERFRFTLVPRAALASQASEPMNSLSKDDLTDIMLAFLDARAFTEKAEILERAALRGDITDGFIDNLAASLDVVIDDGPIEKRFKELRFCVDTRARYELQRFSR